MGRSRLASSLRTRRAPQATTLGAPQTPRWTTWRTSTCGGRDSTTTGMNEIISLRRSLFGRLRSAAPGLLAVPAATVPTLRVEFKVDLRKRAPGDEGPHVWIHLSLRTARDEAKRDGAPKRDGAQTPGYAAIRGSQSRRRSCQ